ncbi:MAG: Lrp/AsnC family transcriptional regulator [Lentisphaerae bacterium]|nr:Lrp/AsnC family transcriptional regulator [Lentisphaerota bacterium]
MNSSRKIDGLDIRIAYMLGEDGRLSNRELARRLGISEGNVRNRLKRMQESGMLRVTAQVDIETQPDTLLAVVGVKIDSRRLSECAEAVAALPSVLTTCVVTGRHDLMALVLAHSRPTLVEFVTDELSSVPGVIDSETSIVLKSINFWADAHKVISSENFEEDLH